MHRLNIHQLKRGLALLLALFLTLTFAASGENAFAAENVSNEYVNPVENDPNTVKSSGSVDNPDLDANPNPDGSSKSGGEDDKDSDTGSGTGTDSGNVTDPAVEGTAPGNVTDPAVDGTGDPNAGKTAASDGDSLTETDTKESEKDKMMESTRFVKNQVISGKKLVFSDDTVNGYYLSPKTVPGNVHIKAGRNSITVYWSLPKNRSDIDGYILLRKSGSSSKYVQIAKLKSSKSSYKDKKSLKKNTMYSYCLVSYKKEKAYFISEKTSLWAGGVTLKSDKVNVYSAVICNKARLNCLVVGSSVVIDLKLPKAAVSKTVRWSSEDTAIAVVDSKGKVTAKGVGKVSIRGKLPSGNFVKITINCMRGGTATSFIAVMKSWLKYNERNKKHEGIVDIYNNYGKLPLNYKLRYEDAWCDACITAAAIASGNVKRIGRECGVWRHVEIFKKKGIWIENGSITPKPGYIIVYSWEKKKQPNNGRPNHIGVVCSVKNGWITTIEGNYKDSVTKRRIPVGWGCIRGYAKPKYKREGIK